MEPKTYAITGILKKIDWIMANNSFVQKFSNTFADFQPFNISDHSPGVLKIPIVTRQKTRSFKMANFVTRKVEFVKVVSEGWKEPIAGSKMFEVVKKMKNLKKTNPEAYVG